MSITEERLKEIKAFKNTDFSDCPVLTEGQMKEFKPSHLRKTADKKQAHIQLDSGYEDTYSLFGFDRTGNVPQGTLAPSAPGTSGQATAHHRRGI